MSLVLGYILLIFHGSLVLGRRNLIKSRAWLSMIAVVSVGMAVGELTQYVHPGPKLSTSRSTTVLFSPASNVSLYSHLIWCLSNHGFQVQLGGQQLGLCTLGCKSDPAPPCIYVFLFLFFVVLHLRYAHIDLAFAAV